MKSANTSGAERWRDTLVAAAPDLPVERLLRWIGIESGGNECSIDSSKKWQDTAGWIQDAGIFQTYFPQQDTVLSGATSASLRVNCSGTTQTRTRDLSDDEMMAHVVPQLAELRAGIAHAQSQLDAAGCSWDEPDRWAWYKFSSHGLPAVAKCMLPLVVQQLERAPYSWDEFRAACEGMDLQIVRDAAALPIDNACTACLHAHGAWQIAFHNAEEMR